MGLFPRPGPHGQGAQTDIGGLTVARFEFKLPDIGEGIAEAEVVAWHVKPGDVVEEDAPLADMMTDKATVELSAPVGGKVIEINGKVGETVAIGSVLAVFETDGEAAGTQAGDKDKSPQATAAEQAPPEEQQGKNQPPKGRVRSEEHTYELQSLMRI